MSRSDLAAGDAEVTAPRAKDARRPSIRVPASKDDDAVLSKARREITGESDIITTCDNLKLGALMERRAFLRNCTALALTGLAKADAKFDVAAFDKARVLRGAGGYLKDKPETVTAAHSPRSTGGQHDFFSEGDYW